MAIRFDSKLNNEIKRTVRNFNQKVARLERLDLPAPQKISTRDIKKDYVTRAELNKRLKQFQGFSTRGAEDVIELKNGVKLTKYEYNVIKAESKRAKSTVTRQLNFYKTTQVKNKGEKEDVTFAQTGDDFYLRAKERKNLLDRSLEDMDNIENVRSYFNLAKKINKDKDYMNSVFKDNYFDMFADLGYYSGYDKEKLEYIKEKMYQLNPRQFFAMFRDDRAIRNIVEYYRAIKSKNIKNRDLKELYKDVTVLYDTIYDNIDEIIKDYA